MSIISLILITAVEDFHFSVKREFMKNDSDIISRDIVAEVVSL